MLANETHAMNEKLEVGDKIEYRKAIKGGFEGYEDPVETTIEDIQVGRSAHMVQWMYVEDIDEKTIIGCSNGSWGYARTQIKKIE